MITVHGHSTGFTLASVGEEPFFKGLRLRQAEGSFLKGGPLFQDHRLMAIERDLHKAVKAGRSFKIQLLF